MAEINIPRGIAKRLNSKYADLIDQSDIEWFSKIRQQNPSYENEQTSVPKNPKINVEEAKKIKTNLIFSYEPINCPISSCAETYLPNDMILHYLGFHNDYNVPLKQLYEKQRLIMTLKPYELNSEEIVCLGLASYGGKEGASQNLTKRKACIMQNVLLQKEFGHLKNDFPVFVLASVVSMEVFSKPTEIVRNKLKELSPFIIIWLAGTRINIPLACTLTAYNDSNLYSRSVTVSVRSLLECQMPHSICNSQDGYFRIFLKELPTFLDNENGLQVELVFHEDFK